MQKPPAIWYKDEATADPRSLETRHEPLASFQMAPFYGRDDPLCRPPVLRYALSYRDVEELMRERGAAVDHTTVFRWVQRHGPELDRRCRPYLKAMNDSYRVDETYLKVKTPWRYLYRAVDSTGAASGFRPSPTRDHRRQRRGGSTRLRGAPAGEDASRELSIEAMQVLK